MNTSEKPKVSITLIGGLLGVVFLCCCFTSVPISAWLYREELGIGTREDADERKPAHKVTAFELCKDFFDDEPAAAKKYRNKIVEVTGDVRVITGKSSISLKGGKQAANDPLVSIDCELLPSEVEKVAKLNKENTVKVTGKLTNVSSVGSRIESIILTKCSIELPASGKTAKP